MPIEWIRELVLFPNNTKTFFSTHWHTAAVKKIQIWFSHLANNLGNIIYEPRAAGPGLVSILKKNLGAR